MQLSIKPIFSIWALLNSPLIIGCDIRNMDDSAKAILMNKDVIAINQDLGGISRTPRGYSRFR